MEAFRDWGRDCYCEPGKENTCKRRFDWQLGDLPYGYDHKYIYSHIGFNLKITDMQAAVGLSQLDHLDDFIAARRRNFDTPQGRTTRPGGIFRSARGDAKQRSVVVWLPLDRARGRSVQPRRNRAPPERAQDRDAAAVRRQSDPPALHEGPELSRFTALENSDRIMHHTFWIGVYPGIGSDAIGYVLDTIHEFLPVAAAQRSG